MDKDNKCGDCGRGERVDVKDGIGAMNGDNKIK